MPQNYPQERLDSCQKRITSQQQEVAGSRHAASTLLANLWATLHSHPPEEWPKLFGALYADQVKGGGRRDWASYAEASAYRSTSNHPCREERA